jgi:hypothetical protein
MPSQTISASHKIDVSINGTTATTTAHQLRKVMKHSTITEHARQIDLVQPRVVFLETRLLDSYHGMLRSRGCEIVAMDPPTAEQSTLPSVWNTLC